MRSPPICLRKKQACSADHQIVIAAKASAALQTLAEFLQAPVLTTAEGKGALSDRHPLALGAMRLRQDPIVEYLAQTDVVEVWKP